MGFKNYLGSLLRKCKLTGIVDNLRFIFYYSKNYLANSRFEKEVAPFKFPPAYFIYETYSLNYENYYKDGYRTATQIAMLFSKYLDLKKTSIHLLDWGCGPARIVRHLPEMLGSDKKIYGCDYNSKYINWGNEHIKAVDFVTNNLHPPTFFVSGYFDVIYGLSIITHLSAESHTEWVKELWRILKPGGILLITSQGNAFKEKLLPQEEVEFNKGLLVVRVAKIEGHRIFSAFQPKAFMEELLNDFTLLTFIEGGSKQSIHGLQDTWLVQKKMY
jgi:ubiquinone/menaquinone biosynthesis C-methylase UbiE